MSRIGSVCIKQNAIYFEAFNLNDESISWKSIDSIKQENGGKCNNVKQKYTTPKRTVIETHVKHKRNSEQIF